MSKRHQDALYVAAGACSASGVAHALAEACSECVDEGLGTMAIRRDSAVRLMVHQLAYLCNVQDVVLDDYSSILAECRVRERAAAFPRE